MAEPRIARDRRLDSTLALLRQPYDFAADTARRLGSSVFEARVALVPTIFMTGAEAARLFYDEARFSRVGALPGPVAATLIGRGGIQSLDGPEHRHRKELFRSLTTADHVAVLGRLFAAEWASAVPLWADAGNVTFYDALLPMLSRAGCAWAGVPLPEAEVALRTRQLTLLFDRAGARGIGHLRSRLARGQADRWATGLIEAVRRGHLAPPAESALVRLATFRALDGAQLPAAVAAVELLNLLRPIVAVAVFIVHAALALHAHPAAGERLLGDAAYRRRFIDEVRRCSPFFPAQAARVRTGFTWRGSAFRRGRRVLLDLYGTNHDPLVWSRPETFDPDRHLAVRPDPFAFVPQGGGDPAVTHRCPGEPVAIELMSVALEHLAGRIDYAVPEQDLELDRVRLPALPRSRFVMSSIRSRA